MTFICECESELFSLIRNITFIPVIILPILILGIQDSIITKYINDDSSLFKKIMGKFPENSYDGDATGLFGVLIIWRFNRELRKDKETLAACRGMYNAYLSLIAAFILLSIFLVLSFSLCS